jgi:hypothetical protein
MFWSVLIIVHLPSPSGDERLPVLLDVMGRLIRNALIPSEDTVLFSAT